MKNQLSPPVLTIAPPVPLASIQVSYVQCTVLGEHALPVRSDEAAPELMNALPLSRVSWLIARATPEFGTSKMASTLSTSYHWRATAEPTSALFWWSAETISTFMPFFAAPKSSTAMRAAATEPGPPISEYRLDMSLITPILITPSEIWALAPVAQSARATATLIFCIDIDINFSFSLGLIAYMFLNAVHIRFEPVVRDHIND